jgi:CheY-like chemotaxis protein
MSNPKEVSCYFIDDQQEEHVIFGYALKRAGLLVNCVYQYSAKAALEQLHKDEILPGLIITDVNMPGMNGFELLEELKRDERLSHIPVYMFSTNYTPERVERAKALGAKEYFVKPESVAMHVELLKKIFNA